MYVYGWAGGMSWRVRECASAQVRDCASGEGVAMKVRAARACVCLRVPACACVCLRVPACAVCLRVLACVCVCAVVRVWRTSAADAWIETQVAAAHAALQIGPLAAVAVQDDVVREVAAGSSDLLHISCAQAAGSAPLVEAVHACHDLLERRIFMT